MQLAQLTQPLIQIMPFSFKPYFQGEKTWIPSDYGEAQNENRFFNEEVRKSQYRFVTYIGINNFPVHNSNNQGKWRMIRYQNGKFLKHEDKQNNNSHIGTQILIFPKCQSRHEKGQLIIYNLNKQQLNNLFIFMCSFPWDFSIKQHKLREREQLLQGQLLTGVKRKSRECSKNKLYYVIILIDELNISAYYQIMLPFETQSIGHFLTLIILAFLNYLTSVLQIN